MKKLIGATLLFLFASSMVGALASAVAERVVAAVETVGGPVTIVASDDGSEHVALLNGRVRLYRAETYGVEDAGLKFEKVFGSFAKGQDVVVLSESDGGTGCRATYVLMAVKSDGTHYVTDAFGNCAAPTYAQRGAKLHVKFPAFKGTPAETWVYDGAGLSKE
ncbi:MAG TPA: hypothetical protein VGX48_27080 [Pyrinomonadaceae bacterium]|jgi:hypothetical protein|nr:hypothetical protein [Pyrinomonadaceae bacterium]